MWYHQIDILVALFKTADNMQFRYPLHEREGGRKGEGIHREESDGFQMDWLFPLQIPSFPHLLVVVFVFLFRLSESKMSVAFI